jgi:hypothetical protein
MDSTKERLLDFAENHSAFLLGAVIVLVLVIIVLIVRNCGWGLSSIGRKRRKKKTLNDDDEMDQLIESIHKKQRAAAKTGSCE